MEIYDNLYPSQYKFKYPKAGEDNSLIAVKVFDLDNLKTLDFDIGKNPNIYIPRMIWSMGNNEFIVFKMNRLQNNLELLSGNFNNQNIPISGVKINKIYSETSSTYIDIHDNTFFINKDEFIWTSEKDGFNHIYLINYSNNTERKLTLVNGMLLRFTDIIPKIKPFIFKLLRKVLPIGKFYLFSI